MKRILFLVLLALVLAGCGGHDCVYPECCVPMYWDQVSVLFHEEFGVNVTYEELHHTPWVAEEKVCKQFLEPVDECDFLHNCLIIDGQEYHSDEYDICRSRVLYEWALGHLCVNDPELMTK